jgi:5-methylcytosine-specific restriction endonuclease McrA
MPTKPPPHKPRRRALKPVDDRLSPSKRGYDRSWRKHRMAIYVRDGGKCCDCQRIIGEKGKWHIDHIMSMARGGGNEASNLQLLCASCHSRKTVLHDGALAKGRYNYG